MADLAQYGFGIVPSEAILGGTIALSGDDVHVQGTLDITAEGFGASHLISWPYFDLPIIAAVPNPPYGALIDPSDPQYPGGGRYVLTNVGDPEVGHVATVLAGFDAGDTEWLMQVVSLRCWTLLLISFPHPDQLFEFDLRWRNGPGSGEAAHSDPASGGGTGGGPPGTVTAGDVTGGAVPNVGKIPVGGSGADRTWSKDELVALAARHDFPDPNLAAAVAMAESGGDQAAVNANDDGSVDRSLWQINSIHGFDPVRLFDADYNADAAYSVSGGGTDWTPWVTFNSGAYLDFL